MNTAASTEVVQGDEHSRDGHYRAKQDLRQQLSITICIVPCPASHEE